MNMISENTNITKIKHITDIIQKIAAGDFSTRATISGNLDSLDAIASGINMLGEEIEAYTQEKEDQSTALLNMLEDVNEAKEESERVHLALKESEKKYRNLIDNISDVVMEVDEKGNISYVSPQIFDVFGYEPHEVIEKNAFDFIHPEDTQKVSEATQGAFNRKQILRFEYRMIHKDGHYVHVSSSGKVVEEGKDFKIVSIVRDITERRRAELRLKRIMNELERSNTELQQFAYVASHDLQEPLRMVSSYMQLLERRYKGSLDEDADEFIRYAVDGASRMQNLINDLLAYSRVGTKGKPFKPTDMKKVFNRALENLKVTIEESSANVTCDELPIIMADASQFIQLLQNLIGNSIKFRGDEVPKIHVSAKKDCDNWQFSVQDNGIGIELEHQDRIFQIFQRLHSKSEYPGTGIGLAVCKKIVERHGGEIWVYSEPGKGSTFYFTVPMLGGNCK